MQGEQNSPFRALVNMVPQQGVPKYDFLRKMLKGSLDSLDSAPAGMLAEPICLVCIVLFSGQDPCWSVFVAHFCAQVLHIRDVMILLVDCSSAHLSKYQL